MLSITLKERVTVYIGSEITITLMKVKGKRVSVIISAPQQLRITRSDYKK